MQVCEIIAGTQTAIAFGMQSTTAALAVTACEPSGRVHIDRAAWLLRKRAIVAEIKLGMAKAQYAQSLRDRQALLTTLALTA
jgi:hypothetical protein